MVTTVAKESARIGARDRGQRDSNRVEQCVVAARFRPAPGILEFREGRFNWRQIWRVAGQKPDLAAPRGHAGLHACALMSTQVIDQQDLPRSHARRQHLLDVSLECLPISSARQDQSWSHALQAQGRNQRGIRRCVARDTTIGPLLARGAGVEWREIQITTTLIDDHEVVGTALLDAFAERLARRFVALAGGESLFLRVQSRRAIARSIVAWLTGRLGWA